MGNGALRVPVNRTIMMRTLAVVKRTPWLLTLIVVAAQAAVSTQDRRLVRPEATSDRRVALVIGNQAYPTMALKNAVQDARDVHAALVEIGFDSHLVVDATKQGMELGIGRFLDKLKAGDVALVYYAGHGLQVDGENFLLPLDVNTSDQSTTKYTAYSASLLQDRIAERGPRLKILILDACRNNPFRSSRSTTQGLAAMAAAGRGTFVAFATGPGSTADDNPVGRNGLFTSVFLEALRESGVDLEQLFIRVRQRVDELSGGRQTPWSNSSVIGRFVFRTSAVPSAPTAPSPVSGSVPSPNDVSADASTPDAPPARGSAAWAKLRFRDAVAEASHGRHDQALAGFQEVLTAIPACAECWLNIGSMYVAKKDLAQAESAFRKALEVNPRMAEAYTGLASVYNGQKRYKEAADAAGEAARLGGVQSDTGEAAFNEGVVAWNAGKIDEAARHFQRAVTLNPSLAVAHYYLGMAHVNQGRLPEGLASMETYLKLAPTGEHAAQAKSMIAALKK
jgi:uncharacterized caspase-like protein